MDWTEKLNDPAFRKALMEHVEETAASGGFLRKLRTSHRPQSTTITLPILPEFSKEPLDAEIVVEDVLDADLIG